MLYGELKEVKVNVLNPPKEATLRLPTSEEMSARMDAQRSIRRFIGRRKTQTEAVPNPKADLDLFNRIRLDKGEEFDEYEARNVIGKLTFCEVAGCERTGNQFRITLNTPFGETVHVMNSPTAKQAAEFRRDLMASMELPHGQEEIRYRSQAAVDLYSGTVFSVEGYAEGIATKDVPAHHKFAIAGELIQAADEIDQPFSPNS